MNRRMTVRYVHPCACVPCVPYVPRPTHRKPCKPLRCTSAEHRFPLPRAWTRHHGLSAHRSATTQTLEDPSHSRNSQDPSSANTSRSVSRQTGRISHERARAGHGHAIGSWDHVFCPLVGLAWYSPHSCAVNVTPKVSSGQLRSAQVGVRFAGTVNSVLLSAATCSCSCSSAVVRRSSFLPAFPPAFLPSLLPSLLPV